MTSEELAEQVEETVRRTSERILGIGREQYDNAGVQRFEQLTVPALFEEAFQELDDVVVYAVMLRIRLDRLFRSLFGDEDQIVEFLQGVVDELSEDVDRAERDLEELRGVAARIREENEVLRRRQRPVLTPVEVDEVVYATGWDGS